MTNYYLTIVVSIDASCYDSLESGMLVRLQPEPNNIVDKNAIAVYYGDEKIGYVANSPETVLENTMRASRLFKLVNNKMVRLTSAILRKESEFQNNAGKMQKRFLAEAFFVPSRQKNQTQQVVYRYRVGGQASKNTGKAQLLGTIIKSLEQGDPINIPVTVVEIPPNPVSNETVYAVLAKVGSQDPEESKKCGTILDEDEALKDLISKNGEVAGKVVEMLDKNTYTIELFPDIRPIDEYFPEIDAAVARCVGQSPEIEGKVSVMLNSGFSDMAIKKVLEQMPALDEEQASVPVPKQIYRQKSGKNLADMVAYMLFGKMIRLVGEKGSGKNTLVETACWLLNRPLCRVQGSSELDKMDILGSRTLTDGSTNFELSNMLKTLMADGIVVLDEANTVRPDVLTLLHSLTDGARAIDVPGYGVVKMGQHACIIYTLNEDYVGTGEMNAATIDRGPSIIVRQETDMTKLLKDAVPNASEADIQLCLKVSDAIQKAVKESGVLTTDAVTIRGYIDALQSCGFIPLKRALIQNVANKAQSESDRATMESIISSFCG